MPDEGQTMNVEFVRAGAGSGKTHYLTQLLADRLASGTARPSGVIATTFTVKAATELRERARTALLGRGRLDLAAAVGLSRIGTVNSVCGGLVERFCFELGISPDQAVLGEAEGALLLASAVESQQTPAQMKPMLAAAKRLSIDESELLECVGKIIQAGRSNNITSSDLAAMGKRNADAMLACWPAPEADHDPQLTAALQQAKAGLQAARDAGNATDVLRNALNVVEDAIRDLREGQLPWKDWHKLCGLNAGAAQRPIVEPLQDQARRHLGHSRFHEDVRHYLEGVFSLAARSLAAFADAKRELGVVDFTDQETLFLQALQTSELVREAIREEVDLVLVDEFQDTSPLQLAIFVELAKLAKSSVWVGDPKQAIYGFRGTDANLVREVITALPAWGGRLGEPLTRSWRSTPGLVSLCNAASVPAFREVSGLKEEDVALSPQREAIPAQPDLINWTFLLSSNNKKNLEPEGFGPAVSALLSRGMQVQDKATGQLRSLGPGDIAILCRTNKSIGPIVAALSHAGIPAASARPGLLSTPEAAFVVACLRRLHDTRDTAASALIIGLSGSQSPEVWLDNRLAYLARLGDGGGGTPSAWRLDGSDAHPLLVRLESLRPRLLSLTPHEALRLAKAESGVAHLAHGWSSTALEAQKRLANVEALVGLAAQYEQSCQGARTPATLNGLLAWLEEQATNGKDDRAVAAHGAVAVMTCHAAKGLEWPVVIVAGLDHPERTALWSVRARTEGSFDADRPLANRVIPYWPYPYGQANVEQAQKAEGSALGQVMRDEALQEDARLLYVTLTRPRDLLVLVTCAKNRAVPPVLTWLDRFQASGVLWPAAGPAEVRGIPVTTEAQVWDMAMANATLPPQAQAQLRYFGPGSPQDHPKLWFSPSSSGPGAFEVTEVVTFGAPLVPRGAYDAAAVGTAIHACIACGEADPDAGLNETLIRDILERWRVGGAFGAAEVLQQVQAFRAWWSRRWPEARSSAEVPVQARCSDGTVVRGQIDLLLSTGKGEAVLFDHKAVSVQEGGESALATKYGAQLDAYALAVESASELRVREQWLFLALAGKAVRLVRRPD